MKGETRGMREGVGGGGGDGVYADDSGEDLACTHARADCAVTRGGKRAGVCTGDRVQGEGVPGSWQRYGGAGAGDRGREGPYQRLLALHAQPRRHAFRVHHQCLDS